MDMKRLMTGTVVGAIAMMAVGYLAWEVLFAEYFAAWDEGNPVVWWALITGNLVMAAILTMWLDKSGASGWMDSAKSGAMLGLMVWLGLHLMWISGLAEADLGMHIAAVVLDGVTWGVAGAAIGMVGGSAAAPASEY